MANIAGGSVVWQLDIDDSKFKSKLRNASDSIRNSASSTEKDTSKSWLKMGATMGAVAGIAQSVFTKAMDAIGSSVSSAIKRVDILNNFPKIMSNMNISASDSKSVINELSKSLQGLPTPLDMAALSVQRLTASTGDVKRSKDVFLALNNAILAGGAPMELQASAMEQFSQSFAKGKPDMMEWRALMSAMPAQLMQLAKHLNMPNVDALGEALREGDISMKAFSDALVELNTKGTSEFISFEKQARNSTNGIQTGIANMQTAIARGVASLLGVLGQENISKAIASIGTAFEKSTKFIVNFIKENPKLAKVIAIATVSMIGLGLAIGAVSLAMGVLTSPITLIAIGIGALIGVVVYFKEEILKVWNVLKNNKVLKQVANLIKGAFLDAWTALKDIFVNSILPALKELWGVIKQNMTVFKVLGAILATVVLAPLVMLVSAWFVALKVFKYIAPVLKVVINVIGELIEVLIKIANVIITVVVAAFTFLANVFMAIYNTTRAVFTGIYNVIRTIWNAVYNFVVARLTAILNFYRSIFNAIYGVIRGVVQAIFNFFAPAVHWLYSRGVAVIQGLINGIRAMVGHLWNGIAYVSSKIGQFFGGAVHWLWDTGRAIIIGLINGIRSAADWVYDAVSGIASRVKDRFKSVLGIKSPSKVFKGFGTNITQGLVNGIDKGMGVVDRAVSGLSNATAGEFGVNVAPSVGGVGQGSGNTSNQTVTIGTVMLGDKNAVQEFFDQLNQDTLNLNNGLTPVQGVR